MPTEVQTRWVVIGLGANLGDRFAQLQRAAACLEAVALPPMRGSHVYESPPAGGPAQPHYLNAAVVVTTSMPWDPLLETILAVERSLGRVRPDPVRWGPRTIDIDLLWTDAGVVSRPQLAVPHPRLTEREFAVQPLLDVMPDATDPHTGRPYAELPAATASLPRVGRLELA